MYLCTGKSARPAPAELPQDRKVARVGGCSGAMFGLPFFSSDFSSTETFTVLIQRVCFFTD